MACFEKITSLPAGVVNSVNENKTELGELFSTHPEIDVVSFTGSSETGKIIMSNAASSVKQVCLELGGKAPAIIFDDADLENAIAEIRRASMALNGQMCTALSRVLVSDSVYEQVQQQLVEALVSVKIGDPLSEGVELGPLIDRENQQRIQNIVDRACTEGNVILKGTIQTEQLEKGCYVSPSIFGVSNVDSWLVQEEHFGPIITIERFANEQEALSKANATRYGLAASVYTKDFNTAMRMSRKLKFGTVWLNSHNRLFAEVETGGYRQSGIGRLHGVEALDSFLETKHFHYECE
jgi:acyl-CoA reductase-like NAD-dependent aldehyde dehydrogenase